jgi:hypothetical protein
MLSSASTSNGDGFRLINARNGRSFGAFEAVDGSFSAKRSLLRRACVSFPAHLFHAQWIEEGTSGATARRGIERVWIESRRGMMIVTQSRASTKVATQWLRIRTSSGIDDLEREYLLAVNRLATLLQASSSAHQRIENRIPATRASGAAHDPDRVATRSAASREAYPEATCRRVASKELGIGAAKDGRREDRGGSRR